MLLLKTNKKDLEKIISFFKNGDLVAFPTETVYGIGCIFNNFNAYCKLNNFKKKRNNKSYTLMLSNIQEINKYAYLSKKNEKFLKLILPGPITIILRAKKLPNFLINKNKTIGIRIPKSKTILKVLKKLKIPILAPSLNRSNEKPINNITEIIKKFDNEISALIITKEKNSNIPSTIISLYNNNIKILREGNIKIKKLINIYKKL